MPAAFSITLDTTTDPTKPVMTIVATQPGDRTNTRISYSGGENTTLEAPTPSITNGTVATTASTSMTLDFGGSFSSPTQRTVNFLSGDTNAEAAARVVAEFAGNNEVTLTVDNGYEGGSTADPGTRIRWRWNAIGSSPNTLASDFAVIATTTGDGTVDGNLSLMFDTVTPGSTGSNVGTNTVWEMEVGVSATTLNTYSGTFQSGSLDGEQGGQIVSVLNAGENEAFVASNDGGIVTITASTVGNRPNATLLYSPVTQTLPSGSEFTNAITPSLTIIDGTNTPNDPDSLVITVNGNSNTITFAPTDTTLTAAATIASMPPNATNISIDNSYEIATTPLASGNQRLRWAHMAPGVEDDLAVSVTTGVNTGGLSVLNNTVVIQGSDDSSTGTLSTWTLFVFGGERTGQFTSASDATSQAAQIADSLSSSLSYTAVASGDVVTITANEPGDLTNSVFTSITTGTTPSGQTAVTVPTGDNFVNTSGSFVTLILDQLALNFGGSSNLPAPYTVSFPNGDTQAQSVDLIVQASANIDGITLSPTNTYEVTNTPIAAGTSRVKWTWDAIGNQVDTMGTDLKIKPGDSGGTLAVENFTTVTQGTAEATTGQLTAWLATVKGIQYSGSFITTSNAASQATQFRNALPSTAGFSTAIDFDSSATVRITSDTIGNDPDTVVSFTEMGDGATSTTPAVTVSDGFAVSRNWSTPVKDGGFPTIEYWYTGYPGLIIDLGNPDAPGDGVTWVENGDSSNIPGSAYWVASRYTIAGVVGDFQIAPVQAKDTGLPFVAYDISRGQGIPALNSPLIPGSTLPTWEGDVIAAVEAFTGQDYSTQLEFGYGTVVSINYDITSGSSTGGNRFSCESTNGSVGLWIPTAGLVEDPNSPSYPTSTSGTCKVAAKFTRDQGWIVPGNVIDGDLIVDGTVAAGKIQANSITAEQIAAGTITASEITLFPQDVGVGTATGDSRIQFSSQSIDIFSEGVLRVRLGNLNPTT